MTSRIDQPPPPTPGLRRAEQTDTRQAIQRHEPEFYKKKKDEDDEREPQDVYDDLTDVSVPALRNFLTGLLESGQPETPAPAPRPVPSAATHAAAAYQRRSAGPPQPAIPAPTPAPATALDRAAAELDRAELLDLIRELDRLAAAGVHSLSLERSNGFVASIRTAVTNAREGMVESERIR